MTTRDDQLAIIRQSSLAVEPISSGESPSLKPLHNIEAVLLDVYGTLFISASGEIGAGDNASNAAAFHQALSSVGLTLRVDGAEGVQRLHDTIKDFHSRSRQGGIEFPEVDIVEVWRTTLHSMRQSGQLVGNTDEVDVATLSLRYELATNPVWPMPGAAECLTELANRGIQLGLISNAQWFTPLLFPALLGGGLDALGIGAEMQFWSWRTGWAKPGEHLFRTAADVLRGRGISLIACCTWATTCLMTCCLRLPLVFGRRCSPVTCAACVVATAIHEWPR